MDSVRILGIDPGLRFTGWGLVLANRGGCEYVGHGVLSIPQSLPFPERLKYLFFKLKDIITDTQACEVAIEEVFVNVNGSSTMKLCMARGVIMAVPAILEKEIFQYTANCIKKTVVGRGHASKDEVEQMLKYVLVNFPNGSFDGNPDDSASHNISSVRSDGTDALAVALCHAQHRNFEKVVKLYTNVG
jgi:crossover junction endodeoxyribonuclease RuvC